MRIFIGLILGMFCLGIVSAGVGIKWEEESVIVDEKEEACLTYKVYNPWPESSEVVIGLSEELEEILTIQDAESKLIPANTASGDAIPIEFCFEIPRVYERDCLVGGLICEQSCSGENIVYEGEVVVGSVPGGVESGGSATTMSVSAPLRIRVNCEEAGRNFTVVYMLLGVISLMGIVILTRKKRKSKK